ncbi:MAG: alpha/beta hydrolase [Tannerellaceae bacterium]
MTKKILIILLLCVCVASGRAQYVPDVLGNEYLRRTICMPDDYEGKVVCTLVKKPELPNVHQAILYIHGYNDYFFQQQLGDSVNAHGYNFYALDLRKYGRSILPNQDPFFCKNLSEYYADIDTALATIRSEGNQRIYLMAHSTGGLITPLYLSSKQGKSPVEGLMLNSPFLEMNMSWFMRKIVMPVISFLGRFFPTLTVQGEGLPSYAHSLLKQYKGEWEYNTNWKMTNGHPKKAGWIHAIHEGHVAVQKGLKLNCPVLVMSSDKSFPETAEWNKAYLTADIVLNIKDIQKYGAGLSSHVTRDTIHNGIHDLLLSGRPARDQAYNTIFGWLLLNKD